MNIVRTLWGMKVILLSKHRILTDSQNLEPISRVPTAKSRSAPPPGCVCSLENMPIDVQRGITGLSCFLNISRCRRILHSTVMRLHSLGRCTSVEKSRTTVSNLDLTATYADMPGTKQIHWKPPSGTRQRTRLAGITEIPTSMLQERVINTETLEYLRSQPSEQPWFLLASYSRPHFPTHGTQTTFR